MKIDQVLLEKMFRIKLNILQMNTSIPLKSIMVTSALHGEGTSTVVAYLASAFALSDKSRVLLVDTNLRRPSLHTIFGLECEKGFFEFMSGKIELAEGIKETSFPHVQIMTAGQLPDDKSLTAFTALSKDTKNAIEKDFDWVLYDTAPVNCYADTLMATVLADGVILVIQAEKTRQASVKQAKESLESVETKILGSILNRRKYVIPRFIYARF